MVNLYRHFYVPFPNKLKLTFTLPIFIIILLDPSHATCASRWRFNYSLLLSERWFFFSFSCCSCSQNAFKLIKKNRSKCSKALQCCTEPEKNQRFVLGFFPLRTCNCIKDISSTSVDGRIVTFLLHKSPLFITTTEDEEEEFFFLSLFMMCFLHSCWLCNIVASVGAMIWREL